MASEPDVIGDRYQIERVIGRGGMAEVFLAQDLVLHRPVAVKVLHPGVANDPQFVERFRREARAAANLNHPNIVHVYDWNQDTQGTRDIYYLVMEYVAGETLADILRRQGAVPEPEVLRFGEEIAGALEAAHRRGVIHRDIKPQNVLIDRSGHVKVVDFGIARVANLTSLTMTNAVSGTPHYLSPEVAQSRPVDARSDVYSLGILLYQMLTGHVPFQGASPIEVALQHVRASPPPLQASGVSVAPATEALVMRALAKNPADRFQTARGMAAAIVGARAGLTQAAQGPAQVSSPAQTAQPARRPAHQIRTARPERGENRGRDSRAWLLAVPLALTLAVAVGLYALHGSGSGNPGRHLAAVHRSSSPRTPAAHATAAPKPPPTSTPNPRPTSTPTAVPPTPVPSVAPQPTAPAAPSQVAAVRPGPPSRGPPQSGPAADPATTVATFYSLVAQHDFTSAAQLWSPSMQAHFPPSTYIDQRFGGTAAIALKSDQVVRADKERAVVAVYLVETDNDGSTRQLRGTWLLQQSPSGWLMVQPNF